MCVVLFYAWYMYLCKCRCQEMHVHFDTALLYGWLSVVVLISVWLNTPLNKKRFGVHTFSIFSHLCWVCTKSLFFCTHVFYVHSSVWMFLIWQMTNNRRIILFFIHYFDLTNYFSFVVIVFNLKFRKNK